MKSFSVRENCERIRERIHDAAARSHRDPEGIRLIAVTKTVPVDRIRDAIEAGITEIGENRLQEAMPKIEALRELRLRWHFIGHLQTNKARKVVEYFDMVQSVDRTDLAAKLNDHAPQPMQVLVEVELGNEETKSGVSEANLSALIESVRRLDRLDLRGLMAIPPYGENPEESRPYFAHLRSLAQRFQLREISMGMSHDFEIAIEEGATMVRVGTALFGARS